MSDLKAVVIQERDWYEEAQHRKQWYVTCNEGHSRHQYDHRVCGRCFRRESDKAMHKCTAECQSQQEQEGAVECSMCGRWLRSRGGLAVHLWARQEEG